MTVLAPCLSLPDPAALAADLATRLPGFGAVDWTAQTGSTNIDLLARARAGQAQPMPWLLGTHLQVGGRGRAGRPWQNEAGACLMLSCAFHVHMPGHRLPALSPLAGLAAAETLRVLAGSAGTEIRVKWPNDVQFGAKKLGGILVETTRAAFDDGYIVVIGMGLNLTNGAALSAALAREVADWSQVCAAADAGPGMGTNMDAGTGPGTHAGTGRDANPALEAQPRAACAQPAALAAALAGSWQRIVAEGGQAGFAGLRERYRAVDALAGQLVNVIDQGKVLYSGTAIGYDEHGRLEVQTAHGVIPVSVGDVSIRLKTPGSSTP